MTFQLKLTSSNAPIAAQLNCILFYREKIIANVGIECINNF